MADRIMRMSKDELMKCLRYLHTIVPSLEHLAAAPLPREAYETQLAQFVDEWGVLPRLAEIRSVLVRSLSESELLELASLPAWTPPRMATAKPARRAARRARTAHAAR